MSTESETQKVEEVQHDPKRIYIGNVPFKSSYKELRELFDTFHITSLTVPKVKSIRRDTGAVYFRKLGYAFGEFSNEEDAKNAVDNLNDTVLNDRHLSVRYARVVDPKERKERSNGNGGKEIEEDAAGTAASGEDSKSSKKKSPRLPKKTVIRKKRPTGPDSTDTIFIANLPADVTSEELQELFASLSPVEIKLASKRARIFKSKGKVQTIPARTLAFIKFADEDTQKKAIEDFNGKTFKDTELVVKIATELVEEEGGESSEVTGEAGETVEEGEAETEAPTAAAAPAAEVEAKED